MPALETLLSNHATELIAAIIALVGGGTATFGGMKFDLPGAGWLKRNVYSDRDMHEFLSRIETPHVLTIIYQESKDSFHKDPVLSFVSEAALRFYGFNERSKLVGKKAEDLLGLLEPWLANKEDFEADQARVQRLVGRGQLATAKVPMIISDNHPAPEFRGKSFQPLIAHVTSDHRKDGTDEGFITVLYLDLNVVPARSVDQAA